MLGVAAREQGLGLPDVGFPLGLGRFGLRDERAGASEGGVELLSSDQDRAKIDDGERIAGFHELTLLERLRHDGTGDLGFDRDCRDRLDRCDRR